MECQQQSALVNLRLRCPVDISSIEQRGLFFLYGMKGAVAPLMGSPQNLSGSSSGAKSELRRLFYYFFGIKEMAHSPP